MSAAASRAWGRGHVDWTPANVAAKVTVSISSPQKRNVHVSTTYTDDEGRIKPTEVILDADSSSTIGALKQDLAPKLPGGALVSPERMKFVIYGAEVDDEQTLQEVSPAATDVMVKMQVRRRGARKPPPKVTDDDDDLDFSAGAPMRPLSSGLPLRGGTTKTPPPRQRAPVDDSAGYDKAAIEKWLAGTPPTQEPATTETSSRTRPFALPPPPTGRPLQSLQIRTMCGGGKSAFVDAGSNMEVSMFRAAVAKLPLALQAWQEDPNADPAEAAEAAKDAKKEPPKKDAKGAASSPGGAEGGDGPPEDKIILLGCGDDLEIEPEEEESLETSPGGGQYFGGQRLVHLRDGKLLGDYALRHESIVYLVIDGRAL